MSSYVEIPLTSTAGVMNKRFHAGEELLFAKNGVIFVDKVACLDFKSLAPLFLWMESGRTGWSKLGHSFSEALEANVLAASPPCECGGRIFGKCACRALDLQKYRRKLDRAVAGPFDLLHCVSEEAGKKEFSVDEWKRKIGEVRATARRRQGKLNAALKPEAVLTVKPWSEKASLLLRSLGSDPELSTRASGGLARIALTASDWREAAEVSEQDVLEARHYSCFA